jgi:hypothetical protein
MTKYNQKTARPAGSGPLATETVPSGRTREGAAGYARDARTELFLRATGAFAGEDGFYEKAGVRDDRLRELTAQMAVTGDGFAWLQGFLPWLRKSGFMRTAPVLMAAEAVHARLGNGLAGRNRQLIDAVLQRADEPGEFLAYWRSRFGRGAPMCVQRGVSDAAIRLYSEFSLLKYDTASHGMRFGDVLEITHAGDRKRSAQSLKGPWQHDLFKFAIDRRHNRDGEIPVSLGMVAKQAWLRSVAAEDPAVLLDAGQLKAAGMTWEDTLSLAGPGMDKARLWEALIPAMGIFALLRNLRNFDQAGVSDEVAAVVAAKLADAEVIRTSGIFPFQLLAAYRHAPSLRWSYPLELALSASLANVPALSGRTLILVDRSPSMWMQKMSEKSDMLWSDGAAVFGAALAMRAEHADLVEFWGGSKAIRLKAGESVLKLTDRFSFQPAPGGTDIPRAVAEHLKGHDRVIIITDEQTRAGYLPSNMEHFAGGHRTVLIDELVPRSTPLFMWNFGGYAQGATPAGTPNRHLLSGLNDASFRLLPVIESAQAAKWPWESTAGAAG